MKRIALLLLLVAPGGLVAQEKHDEQFYRPGSFNWKFLHAYPEAARLFNAFDYGHAVLYETLWSRPDAPAELLETERFTYLTNDLLRRPPRFAECPRSHSLARKFLSDVSRNARNRPRSGEAWSSARFSSNRAKNAWVRSCASWTSATRRRTYPYSGSQYRSHSAARASLAASSRCPARRTRVQRVV